MNDSRRPRRATHTGRSGRSRFHAFFTTSDAETLDTVAADNARRGHAIIAQVHADLKNSALAHLRSGKFAANAA